MAKPKSLSDALRVRQAALGLSKTQAAQAIGVDRSVYSRWVNGHGHGMLPSVHNVPAVAAFLELDEHEVLDLYPETYRLRATRSTTNQIAEMYADIRALRSEVQRLTDVVNTLIEGVVTKQKRKPPNGTS